MNPQDMLELLKLLAVAAASYGAIRADLRAMNERIARVEGEADKAHDRIDKLLKPTI